MNKPKPHKKTVSAAIRASVPDGKLSKARIVVSDQFARGKSPLGGFTQYGDNRRDVVKVGAPVDDDSFGITVRGHETRHATRHKLARKKPMTENEAIASQIVDDVNIESTPVPRTKSERAYRRAHLATAVHDLRNIVNKRRNVDNGYAKNDVAYRNSQILGATRVLSMLENYGYGGGVDEREVYDRSYDKLSKAIGEHTLTALHGVVAYAKRSRMRNRAISMLTSLMESEPSIEEVEGEREAFPDPEGILEPITEGGALDGHMKITDLRPKTVFCAKEKSIMRRHAPSGVIINPARFVNAIVSGESHGLFSRRVRQKAGGTVVIDASGSMHATAHNLSELCKLCPTATVAYYSGSDGRGNGELCIYALEGKRFSGELPDSTLHGGNAVDLPAIKWLMRLPKPWTLISDLGFCGGVLGSETIAHALVERAQHRGDLTVHHSLDAAYEAFGGKGILRNSREEDFE